MTVKCGNQNILRGIFRQTHSLKEDREDIYLSIFVL